MTKNTKAARVLATAGLSLALMIGGASAAFGQADNGSGDNGSGDNGSGATTTTTTAAPLPNNTTGSSPDSLPNTGAEAALALGGAGALGGVAFAARRFAAKSKI